MSSWDEQLVVNTFEYKKAYEYYDATKHTNTTRIARVSIKWACKAMVSEVERGGDGVSKIEWKRWWNKSQIYNGMIPTLIEMSKTLHNLIEVKKIKIKIASRASKTTWNSLIPIFL